MRFKYVFYSKEISTIQTISINFDVIPLNNADIFLLHDKAILLHLESSQLELCFETQAGKQDIYFLYSHTKH